MGSHRSISYQPQYAAQKRPFRRSVQIFLIEWTPVIVTLALALLIIGLAYQIAG
jgi:hypothetical protein